MVFGDKNNLHLQLKSRTLKPSHIFFNERVVGFTGAALLNEQNTCCYDLWHEMAAEGRKSTV